MSTSIASPSPRHHLAPMRSRALHNLNTPRNQTLLKSTAGKRSYSDENSDPQILSTKRVKSALVNSILKDDIFDSPPKMSFGAGTGRRVLGDKNVFTPRSPALAGAKRGYENAMGGKEPLSPSLTRKFAIATPKSKLAKVPAALRRGSYGRVSPPPTHGKFRLSSIDAAFSSSKTPSLSSSSSTIASTPTSEVDSSLVPVTITPMPQSAMPQSWFFDIHEDTAEDVLENLMEFSTGILDISDDSDSEFKVQLPSHELHTKGKENIPPARLAELLSGKADEVARMMMPPPSKVLHKKAPGAGPGGKVLREHREALKGLPVADFYPPTKEECSNIPTAAEKAEKVIEKEEPKKESPFLTKKQLEAAEAEFMIWESSPSPQASPEPESMEERTMSLVEDDLKMCKASPSPAPSSPGASDKENASS